MSIQVAVREQVREREQDLKMVKRILSIDANSMEFRSDGGGFSRPAAMFRTLRRLHGHNLENQGLNNLTDAFQNFVTRAKYFSIGRLRRTWSHSAIEFMKYRRLLPMLTSEGQQGDQFDGKLSC
uniref:Uncharacterized protein n=2 Tax=Ascaris lumbricoides TaxID=6252 RepID=A0A0M3HG12_ASCLU